VLQARLIGELPEQGLLLGGELRGDGDLHDDQLVALPPIPLQTLTLDPEFAPWLRAGRDPEHDFLSIQRPNPEARAQGGLGHVDRDVAQDVESLPAKEPVGLHLEGDNEVAGG